MNKLHALLFAIFVMLVVRDAHATKVKVRGKTRIMAQTLRGHAITSDAGPVRRPLYVQGTLEDDVGTRLANDRVELQVASASDGHKVRFDSEGALATTCETPPVPLPRLTNETVTTTTDASGRFCARLVLPAERYLLSVTTAESPLLEAGHLDLGTDLVRRSVSLRFDGASHVFSLDKEDHEIIGVASFEDEDVRVPAELLPITLVTGRGMIVATEVTGAQGSVSFRLPSRLLGVPGPGELQLQFPGDAETANAAASLTIEKHAKVALSLAQPVEPTSAPEDGVPISVQLSTNVGVVPNGALEARLGDQIVGAAPVRDGKATFAVSFAAPERQEVAITIRFAPEAPWWEAPEALGVRVPLASSPPWSRIPLLVATALVALFVVLGRIGRVRTTPRAPKSVRGAPPAMREGISVLEPAKDGAGWSGRIVDAHDRSPVAGARVVVETSDFQGTQVLVSAFGGDDGSFVLAPTRIGSRAHLVVDAPLHTSLRKPLPQPGVLEIALVSRKRALLDRLVDWARLRGKPYDARPEPTPGHVRSAAGKGSSPARWADAVEAAAFGPEPIDGRAEAEIDALKPDVAPEPKLPVEQTKEAKPDVERR